MKRAIYVGVGFSALSYGMTGTMEARCNSRFVAFYPDGFLRGQWFLERKEIYIPAEDQSRHCPKP